MCPNGLKWPIWSFRNTNRLIKCHFLVNAMEGDKPFGEGHAEAEIHRTAQPSTVVHWTAPNGRVFKTIIPPTVYPPREDTSLLASVFNNVRFHAGADVLEIGCGSGVLSLYAATFGCKITACDVNPLAVASTRALLQNHGYAASVLEGGPGPAIDGGLDQWAGDRLYDVVLWNTPYLSSSVLDQGALGPMEEAALTDTDREGLVFRFYDLLSQGRLLHSHGVAFLTVSSEGCLESAEAGAWHRGLAARRIKQTVFENGEELSVLAVWHPYTSAPLVELKSTTSTNDEVLQMSSKPGTSVRALHQTMGRGRRGNNWMNQTEGLMASWQIQGGSKLFHNTMDQLRVGRSLVRYIRHLIPVADDVCLKWPNDVYLNTPENGPKKAGGVLFEAVSRGARHQLVLGIGLNLLNDESTAFASLDMVGVRRSLGELHNSVHAMVASLFEAVGGVAESVVDIEAVSREVDRGIRSLGGQFYREKSASFIGLDPAGNMLFSEQEKPVVDPDELRWSNI